MSQEIKNDQDSYMELRITSDEISIIRLRGGKLDRNKIGSPANIRNLLQKDKLSWLNLEKSIELVENMIMPVVHALPKCTELMVSGTELEETCELISISDKSDMPIQSVEHLFSQLADYAGGSTGSWQYNSPPDHVAVALVVLREVMHHGGFMTVSVSAKNNIPHGQ